MWTSSIEHRSARTCNLVPVTMTARDNGELSFGSFPQGILAFLQGTLSSSNGNTSNVHILVQIVTDCT